MKHAYVQSPVPGVRNDSNCVGIESKVVALRFSIRNPCCRSHCTSPREFATPHSSYTVYCKYTCCINDLMIHISPRMRKGTHSCLECEVMNEQTSTTLGLTKLQVDAGRFVASPDQKILLRAPNAFLEAHDAESRNRESHTRFLSKIGHRQTCEKGWRGWSMLSNRCIPC
jgi:hypothetical protein